MGSGASSASSQTGSNPNVNHCSGNESRKTSTIQSKKHSSSAGFIMLSYEPTHTPLGRKHGFIKEGFPEHGLIQDRYFLIKDHFKGIDKLRTTDKFGAPNFRKAQGSYPVYGMGQPTRDGLGMVIQTLLENGHKVSCFALFFPCGFSVCVTFSAFTSLLLLLVNSWRVFLRGRVYLYLTSLSSSWKIGFPLVISVPLLLKEKAKSK